MKTVTFFSVLMRHAKEEAVARKSGDSVRIAKAAADHEAYRESWGNEVPCMSNAPVSGGTPSAQVACSAIRRCEDCAEMPDDGTCDKCGDSILTTKDAFVPNDQAHR